MNVHKNAPLTPQGRERIVAQVLAAVLRARVAAAFDVSLRTAGKWVARFKAKGFAGLVEVSSKPHKLNRPTPTPVIEQIIALRRHRLTGKHIAREVGVSPATVSRMLKRAGLSRMKDLELAGPVRRYEYANPGDMIDLDIKTLGRFDKIGHRITGDRTGQSNFRGVGWEYVHVFIDDALRIAYTDIMADQNAQSAIAFLKAAVAYYRKLGITITRVMTDNGSCYKAHAFGRVCRALGLWHIRTKPYTPRTNGKAERFIQTAIREWAYAKTYQNSEHRAQHLPMWTRVQLASTIWRHNRTNTNQSGRFG